MKILMFIPVMLVAFAAFDQAALESRYTDMMLAQTERHGGEISRDIRHWISKTLTGR